MTGGGNLVRYERYRKAPRTPRSAHARYYYTRSLVLESPVRRRGPPRTRCQSAPKIMDSHSRSASPREPMRPQIRPPSPPSPTAFDNRAYQHDESDPNHNESFTSNGPSNGPANGTQNGHKPNGDTKLEAVNLELINLTPKNGTKKDTAVDMNASNPYDEYFVPVNEHRKFMRGEKLYVTADKRGEKGGCKRPLCWTLLVLVVAAIVAVIVLAATGILFSGSPTALEQYNSTISSARAFGGVLHDDDHSGHDHSGHDHSEHDHSEHDHSEHDHSEHDHSEPATEPAQTQHGPETQNDVASVQNVGLDESDMSLYVPRTLEGELKIDNEEFSPALADPDSEEYREFVATFTEAMKRAVFDRNTLENGDNDVSVEVVQLRKGSVVVTYRIHWTPKLHRAPTTDLLTADSLKTRLDDYLEKNNRMINVYHVADEKVEAKPVLDICQIDNNQCEHGCEFDEMTLEFTCTCPHGQMLDMNNPKQCMSILENSYPMEPMHESKDQTFKSTAVDSYPSTTKPIPDEEAPTKEVVVANEHFDWKDSNHAILETTTETEADMNFSHIFGNGDNEHKTEAPTNELNAEPEPAAEPKPEPEPTSETVKPEHDAEPEAEPAAEPEAQPATEPAAEPEAEPAAEPAAEPEAEPAAEPATEPEAQPAAEPAAEPEAEPAAEREVEPAAEPAAEPTAEPAPETEPSSQPEPAPAAEPTLENEHNLEVIPSQTAESAPQPTSELEPASEPKSEPEPEPEPTAEPEPETKLKLEPEPAFKSAFEHEPNVESEQTLVTEPTSEPEPVSEHAVKTNSVPEVVATTEPELILPENSFKISEPKQNTEHESNSFNKPILFTNEDKYDSKVTKEMETSTTRVSISEPNIINEPSYEPKPEIVSIFSKQSPGPAFVAVDNRETTTEINDWLDDRTVKNEKQSVAEPEIIKNFETESEERSFKSIPLFGEEPTTTVKIETSTDQIMLAKVDDKTEEVFTNAPTENQKVTTVKTIDVEETGDNSIVLHEQNTEIRTTEMPTDNNTTEKSQIPFTNESIKVTLEPKSEDEHLSIINQTVKSDEEKLLMDALNKKDTIVTEITTETSKPDEGMEITFDTINSLYNRSSKSIENQTESKQETTQSIMHDIVTEISTESDWLSEPVTEISIGEAINNIEKHETTESPVSKVEEIINAGKPKDDFEPDYLNNMSSNNNKMSEQDEPMYGLAQDYDSEDSRVKRVNTEKEVTTVTPVREEPTETFEKMVTKVPVPVDATTVVEYIYKTAETTTPNNVVASKQGLSSEDTKPAPVWEESESEISVKELPKVIKEEATTPSRVDNTGVPTELLSTTTTASETTSSKATETPSSYLVPASSTSSSIQTVDTESQNTTQINNLNVTIYEISSHNTSSSAVKDANAQANDFVDHETEMNPFLPEVENNKVLVKKLQEGHDIEPNNLTEIQNENNEEHSNNSETLTNQADNKATSTMAPMTTEDYATFNELMKSSQENQTENAKDILEVVKSEEIPEHKEMLPVSTFLLDTDDLDIGSTHKTTIAVNNIENALSTPSSSVTDDDSEYLSVVPITEERLEEKEALKKSYSSESMQELNDISDSPKKSDRRTLDETKFDSVQNNEA